MEKIRQEFDNAGVEPTSMLVGLLMKAYGQKAKTDDQKRSFVYNSLFHKLKNDRKLPKGKLVYPEEIVGIIRAIFPSNVKAANHGPPTIHIAVILGLKN